MSELTQNVDFTREYVYLVCTNMLFRIEINKFKKLSRFTLCSTVIVVLMYCFTHRTKICKHIHSYNSISYTCYWFPKKSRTISLLMFQIRDFMTNKNLFIGGLVGGIFIGIISWHVDNSLKTSYVMLSKVRLGPTLGQCQY